MKKSILVISIALLSVLLLAAIIYAYHYKQVNSSSEGFDSSVQTFSLTSITYDNFASELSSTAMVKAIPAKDPIVLKFYNFKTGERQWEKAYIMSSSGIKETSTDTTADIVISIDSKYLQGLTNQNLCQVIQNANSHGDLGVDTSLSKAALAWKFSSLLKYKSCFGL